MKKYIIFLFMTILLIGLTVVSAEEITQDSTDSTTSSIATTQDTTTYQQTQSAPVTTQKEDTIAKEDNSLEQTTNSSQKQDDNTIHKTQKNVKSASASEEISSIELSTKTKLEYAFSLAKLEIDNAQSTYEKEQIPDSVKEIVNNITLEAQRAETIYSESGDTSLRNSMRNIRNYAGYADLLIHPEKLTDPSLASQHNTRPLYRENGKYNLLTIVAQRLNNTQDAVYINLTSDEFQNLYNDVGEIHHPGEYDRYGEVVLVNKTKFIKIKPNPEDFELIPFPIARIYLESFYYKGYQYTQTLASCGNASGGYYHVDGSTLTKSIYHNYTTNTEIDGNSGIVFWKMNVTDNPNMKYVLTNERYYPDRYGHPPDNMPAENNDDNGIYFVGYVIKTETGGIHIDGVIVEYRVPIDTHNVNFTVKKVWNDSNNQDGIRPETITVQLLADGKRYGDNIVLYKDNNWRYDYINLPKYNSNNEEIVYTINELTIPTGYTVSYNNYTITNTHIPETKDIVVLKEWDDDHNRDGIRPSSVTVDLYADNVLKDTVVINSSNWRYVFKDLDVYANGMEISYSVRERAVSRYSTSVRNVSNEFIITNSYTPRVRNVTVRKVWDDNDNQDGLRPGSISVQLLKDGTPYLGVVRLNSNNNWSHTFTNLPVNADGQAISYTAIETSIPDGYTATNNALTITNTHIPETTEIEVFKEWDDDHNRDGIRPDSVVVNLLADGEVVDEISLSLDNSWRHNFEELAVYNNGRRIVYTVEENPIANYTASITNTNHEFIIKNTHTPLVKELTVIKVWDDHENEHQLRPDSVQAQLFADGEKYGEAINLTVNNNWKHTFTNLPVNFDGKEIFYVVKEVVLPEEYYNTIEFTAENEITITNIFDPEHAHVKVIKEWNDNHDSDKLRPTSVQVQLYANGEKQGNPVTLNQNNYWRHSFDNLIKYINNVEVVYTVEEVTDVPGYTSTLQTLAKNEFAIVNTHSPETINITINKAWDDNDNQDGIRPETVNVILLSDGEENATVTLSENNNWTYTFTNLIKYFDGKEIVYSLEEIGLNEGYTTTYDGYTITNVHTPESIELHVVKEWLGNFDQDGLRPDSVRVQLNKDGVVVRNVALSESNNWSYTFSNLAKYEDGKLVNYTVSETSVPNYTTEIIYSNNKVIIRNTHVVEKVNVTVRKVWDDNDNQDDLRPGSVRVALLADGEEYEIVTLSEANNWRYTFTNLDKYHKGNLVKYTVDERGIPDGYTVTYNGYTITNTHTPETVDLYVIVEWDDLDNIDEIRPDNVIIIVYKDGEPIVNKTISPDDQWNTVFEDLPKYENGTLIKYTADEILPNGYNKTVEIEGNEVIITNIHRPEEINITVKKIWIDDDNRDNLRPNSIMIALFADGDEYRVVSLNDIDAWEYIFINLPKTRKGVDIVYTVKELDVINNYTTTIDGYTITNTHAPETVDIKVNVDWDDLNDTDGIRPDNVTIIVYKDGEPIVNRTITPDDDWKTVFEDLPKYENGTLINYTADEILPDGYTRTIEINDNEINITNIHRPETVDVNVDVVWDDLDNQDGIRPDEVTIILYADGVEVKRISVTGDDWNTVFEDLPKYDNGKLIKYTIDEVLPDGYTKTIESDGNNFTVTNVHRPDTVDVNVDVVWDDLDNQDGIRPDEVTIILYADGVEVKRISVTGDDWNTVFEDLPKYDNGKLIKYTIDEVLPDGYTKTIESDGNNFVVTNVHRPETVNIPVKINWDDLENIDNIRPDNVTLILYADGEEIQRITITPDDDWSTIFENLPKYKDGKLIKYTVDEVLPNGYTKTITESEDGFIITNIHRPQLAWTWKLIELVPDEPPIDNPDDATPDNTQPTKDTANKWKGQYKYTNYRYQGNYRYNRYYNRYNRYNRYYRGGNRISPIVSGYKYRLYIQLYNEYLAGNISFEDFIVLLEKEGLDSEVFNFNEDGTITIDYENLEDVPDTITVEYKNDDIPATTDEIDTSNPDNNEAPVIDSGEVKIPAKSESSSNKASSSSQSDSQSNNNQANSDVGE